VIAPLPSIPVNPCRKLFRLRNLNLDDDVQFGAARIAPPARRKASMAGLVDVRRESGIDVIVIDNPPVNALNNGVRTGLVEALARARDSAEVHAVVLACAGRTFIAGAYIFGAVCPQRRATEALVVPAANTEVMSLHLAEIGRQVAPGSHGALVLDGAGYHVAKDLAVPDNITLVPLPPYAPEPNPIENVWEYLRGNKLAITVFDSYDDILDKACDAWTLLRQRPKPHRVHHNPILGNGHSLRPLVLHLLRALRRCDGICRQTTSLPRMKGFILS
jgi:transposase